MQVSCLKNKPNMMVRIKENTPEVVSRHLSIIRILYISSRYKYRVRLVVYSTWHNCTKRGQDKPSFGGASPYVSAIF